MKIPGRFEHRRACRLLAAVITLVLTACATLPDFAAPKTAVRDLESADLSDVIGYRQLTRADFTNDRPPQGFDARMAAVTCVYIEPLVDPDAIEIRFVRDTADRERYRVTLHNLRYRAMMDRSCSWWNPETDAAAEQYTLEHEQVHFALFELAARRWSRAPPVTLEGAVSAREEAVQAMREQFHTYIQEQLEALNAENRRFDKQTSMKFNPERQQAWLERVRAELVATQDQALPAPGGECRPSEVARRAIDAARAALGESRDREQAAALIEQAEAAAAEPECDSVRALILADKARRIASGDPGGEE